MGLDSNSPGDDRTATSAAEKLAGTGLKLVGERGAAGAPGAAPGPGPGRTSGATSDTKESGAIPGSSPFQRGDRKQGRHVPLWLFAGMLVVFLIGYGYQTQHASQLEADVARLEASLSKAEDRLESHRTHLLEIRGGVHDLSSRLASLRALIDRDPTAETPKQPTAKSPTPAAP